MRKLILLLLVLAKPAILSAQIDFLQHDLNQYQDLNLTGYAAVADINSDNHLDIIATATNDVSSDNNIYWFENDGEGGLTSHIVDSSNANSYHIKAADLDNDGDIDILSKEAGLTGNMVWLSNDGSGNFSIADTLNVVAHRLREFIISDLDSDGDNDIIYRYTYNSTDIIYWLENDSGQFNNQPLFTDEDFKLMEVSDIDADGDRDIILNRKVNGFPNYDFQLLKLSNDSLENFSLDTLYTEQSYMVYSLEVSDIDNDGDNDMITTSSTEDVMWLVNDGSGNYSDSLISGSQTSYPNSGVEVVDQDQDGDMDILFTSKDRLSWFLNDGNQSFTEDTIRKFHMEGEAYSSILKVENFDNDVDLDIVLHSSEEVVFLKNNGVSGYDHTALLGINSQDKFLTMDYDSDGDLDFISSNLNHVRWHENLGDHTYKQHILPNILPDCSSLETVDLNMDGLDDIIITYANDPTILWYKNNGDLTFDRIEITTNSTGIAATEILDLDTDGDLDIVVSAMVDEFNVDGRILWYENDGNQVFSEDTIAEPYRLPYEYYSVDLNSDGFMDLVIAEQSATTTYKLKWYENDGNQNFVEHYFFYGYNMTSTMQADFGDLNGDGEIDFVVTEHYPNNQVAYYLNNGNEVFPTTIFSTVETNTPSSIGIRDMDYDGDMDIYGSRNDTAEVFWYENDGNLNFTRNTISNSVVGANELLVEDLDSDGDYDIVSRSEMNVHILENAAINDYLQVNIIPFIDYNQNGLFDSLDNSFYGASAKFSPGVYYAISSDTSIQYFLNVYDTYEFNLLVDTTIWIVSDSLTRSISVDSLLQMDTSLYIGLSPIYDYLLESDVVGGFPRCGTTINHHIQVQNYGSIIDSGYFEYHLDNDASFVSSIPAPDTIDGQTLIFGFSDLLPSQSENITVQVQLPLPIDTNYHMLKLHVDTGQFAVMDSFELEEIIRCSYDPNDKQVFPNHGEEGYVLSGSNLEYLIRFQNTGNDTAFVVEIRDTLDSNIDMNSFELISSSDPVNISVENDTRAISFLFENIKLTDTVTNELESHGFVKYAVRLNDSLNLNQTIHNKADIYFDLNPPITTNTTTNTVYDCSLLGDGILSSDSVYYLGWNNGLTIGLNESFVEQASWFINDSLVSNSLSTHSLEFTEVGLNSITISLENKFCQKDTTLYFNIINNIGLEEHSIMGNIGVYPNPTSGKIFVVFEHEIEKVELKQLNILGQELLVEKYPVGNEFELDLIGEKGVYLIEVSKNDEILSRFKVLKR